MTRFGDGLAVGGDLAAAATDAARQALDKLEGRRPDVAAVFVTGDDPSDVAGALEVAARCTGARHVLGSAAGGVLGGGRGVEQQRAVSVWAAELPGAELRSFHLEVIRTPDGLAVVGLPPEAAEARAVVLLAEPYSFPVEGFVARSNAEFPGVPLIGGIAAAPRGAGSGRLLLDGRVVERGAVGVLLSGDVVLRAVVSQGCRPVGPSMTVTRAAGNTLLELAGAPALEKLEQVVAALDPLDQALISRGVHLGIAMDEYADEHDRGDFLIRGVLGTDDKGAGLVVGDVVDVGRTVRFHVRDADAADEELRQLLELSRKEDGAPEGALLFTCNGRGRLMFPDAGHDLAVLREVLGVDAVAGFFANGELGPVGGRNHLHGFTASVLAFGP